MRIDKEKFNKLKQLDRIEFRQKAKTIDDNYLGFHTTVTSCFYVMVYFLAIIIVNTYIIINNSTLTITPSMWILIIIPIAYLCDYISMYMNFKRKRELIEEYFKVEVKE